MKVSLKRQKKKPIAFELTHESHAIFIYLSENGCYELTFDKGKLITKEHITINAIYGNPHNRWNEYQERKDDEKSMKREYKHSTTIPLTFNFQEFVEETEKNNEELHQPFPEHLLSIKAAKFSSKEYHTLIPRTVCYDESLDIYYNNDVNLFYDSETQKLIYAGPPRTDLYTRKGIAFDKNGKIEYIGDHQGCNKHGDVTEYSEDGKVTFKGTYTDGKRNKN